MALRLQIISDQRQELGDRAQIVFGVGGGSIGRAADNDWVLPDPRRYLSARHARILFRDGHYEIEDTSTNGVFVNNTTAPIGRRNTHTIKDGDTLRFGEYHLRARVDAVEVHTSLSASMVAVDHVTPIRSGAVDRLDDSEGIAPSLNLEDLFVSDGAAPSPLAAPAEVATEDKFQRARAAARARLEGNTPAIFDVRAGLQTFCRGAGIDAARLPPEADSRMLLLAGQMLRESILGLQDIVRVQRAFQQQNRIEAPPPDVEGPSPDAMAAGDFLLRLLNGHEGHQLDAVMLLRAYFTAARRHDAALRPALRAAVAAFLSHLDPEGIATRAAARGTETGSWDIYGEIYRSLTQAPDGQLPHLFGESLAQAYLKALKDPESGD
jgi:predicted component of type VI protein secretion system